jgi:predicted O-linked N-acetylglucosamine transferase (SPINDLY family)
MNPENLLIQEAYDIIYRPNPDLESVKSLVNKVNQQFPKSYILNYYIGSYFKRTNQRVQAEVYFRKSIKFQPLFTAPYFELCDIISSTEIESLLSPIFDKKTLNPTSSTGAIEYNLMDNMRITSILVPIYQQSKDNKKIESIAQKIIPRIKSDKTISYRHVEIWKNIHLIYATILSKTDMDRANEYYLQGLEGLCSIKKSQELDIQDTLHRLDKKLIQGYFLTSHYTETRRQLSSYLDAIYQRYRNSSPQKHVSNNTIRIGYLSPDFNKNAVGLFVTALLKYYDRSRFDVYVYYNNQNEDEFTQLFRSYPVHWFNVASLSTAEKYRLIQEHNIDVLVDLITMGVGGELELIAMKPAPVIINYLGYPDVCHIKEYTYRITDSIADPQTSLPFIYLPRCFLCYTLFESIRIPDISYTNSNEKSIYIGIMNRASKHSETIRHVWKSILKERKNYILCIKLDRDETALPNIYEDFPKNQLKLLPFTDNLPDYLAQFNHIDFCIDTYPYSGTTTTCSSLAMGVPVFTYYPKGHHVNNVSASIIMNSSLNKANNVETVCTTLNQYKNNILTYKIDRENEQTMRIERRRLFIESMNPSKFMTEYESAITSIVQ